jgi:hypothetical protein
MANYSAATRKEQVLARLKAANGGWVDGPEIANEAVGGSEGLRRLRELADEGHNIRKRKHPDTTRDIFQYRLAPAVAMPDHDEATEVLTSIQQQVAERPPVTEPAEKPVYPQPVYEPQTRISTAIKRKEDGTFEYVPPQRAIHAPEQLTALADEPQVAGTKFDALPKHVDWGSVAVCPRCKSKTTRGRDPKVVDESTLTPKQRRDRERKKSKAAPSMIDDAGVKLFKDPTAKPTQPCHRCNGYGIVPNVGPVPFTPPSGPEPAAPPVEAPSIEAFPDA